MSHASASGSRGDEEACLHIVDDFRTPPTAVCTAGFSAAMASSSDVHMPSCVELV